MAFQQESDETFSLDAAANLSGSQYCFVKVTAALTCNITTAATDFAAGVLQNTPSAAGRSATVQGAGISKVRSGAAIAAGDRLTSDATGRAITTTTAGNRVHGIALQAASAADQYIAAIVTETIV